MMLEQVVRRNRLRAVALALLAGLNAWLVVSLLVGAALWLATSELGAGTPPVVVTALVVGGLGTGVLLRHALRVRSRIVESAPSSSRPATSRASTSCVTWDGAGGVAPRPDRRIGRAGSLTGHVCAHGATRSCPFAALAAARSSQR
jgi:hypothetical protein